MINHTDENNNPEIQCKFGNAIKELDICRLLKESNIRKKKGGSVYEIFPSCCWYFRLQSQQQRSCPLIREPVEHRTFFRASKSLLCLGSEFQGLSYDMTISSTAIVFTRYILLEWLRRKTNDPKTICELFYMCCDDIQDIELCTALSSLVAIFVKGLRTEAMKITKAIKTQLINWFVSQPAFIKALFPETAHGSLS